MKLPTDLLYADTHEWLKVEGTVGIVGISDHAQNELSDVVFIELPKVGTQAKARTNIAVVESVKAASDIYSPVSGEVIEVNMDLQNDPALLNADPYGKGWIYKIKLAQPDETKNLKDAEGYKAQIGG